MRKKIVSYLNSVDNATISEIAAALGLDYETIRLEIDKLKKKCIIKESVEKHISVVYSTVK